MMEDPTPGENDAEKFAPEGEHDAGGPADQKLHDKQVEGAEQAADGDDDENAEA